MGIIKVLPEDVIAKIAAGEVVERPASVVKELIDNAIDAGATSIEVNVVAGGKKSITVIDNGCGMDEEDARRCVERHATSKISSDADLVNIRTLGFRGEALSAIAAISKVQIETKAAEKLEGTLVSVDGGEILDVRAAGCPAGTRICVDDLFFNVPARKKFLKSDGVEYGHVADVVCSMALANSSVRFELSHDGEAKIRCHRVGDIKNRIEDVLGDDVGSSVFEFTERGDGVELDGFIVKEEPTRATAKDIHFFVNGRPVKDRILQHALLSGIETFMPKGRYPVAVLYLTIDPSIVDVNVHPTKREVRFANGSMIHDFVASAVRKLASGSSGSSRPQQRKLTESYLPMQPPPTRLSTTPAAAQTIPAEVKDVMMRLSSCLRVIGQLSETFIVCEGEEGELVLIDQHAAHERLGFETLKEQQSKGKVEQQRLLLPEQLKLSPKDYAIILEHLNVMDRAGFEMEPFGGDVIVVKSVPSLLGDVSLQTLFEKIASELADFGSQKSTADEMDKIFALIACHRQVRAGDRLTNEEMQTLVHDIERTGISHCPHGRPAMITIDRSEVDKWFKRT